VTCAAVQLTPVLSEHMYSMALALRCGSCCPPTLPYKIQKAVRFAKSAGPDARVDLACKLLCNPLGSPPLRRHVVCHHCAEAVRFIGALVMLKAAPKLADTLRANYKD
jgi:hypothetical protein